MAFIRWAAGPQRCTWPALRRGAARRRVIGLCALAALWGVLPDGAGTPAAQAQSLDWIASLLVPAQGPPFVSEWDRNPQTLLLTVTYTGGGEREVLIEGVLREVGGPLLARAVSFPVLFPGGPITRTFNGNDLQDWRLQAGDREQVDRIVRAGVIPEAEYEICARIVTLDRLLLTESCSESSIQLPDRPELLYPGDQDQVGGSQPTFQWTPVLVPPAVGLTYRLRVVERYPGQTPRQALDANPAHLETEVGATPLLMYPPDGLPFEDGREYAWEVEALDGGGEPLLAGGLRSQAWTFTRASGPSLGGPTLDLPDEPLDAVELIGGLARITGLSGLNPLADPLGQRYSGTAWLEVLAPQPLRTRVQVTELVVSGQGVLASVVGGEATAPVPGGALPLLAGDLPVEVDRLSWDPIDGLQAGARVRLPDGSWVPLRGDARYTAGGIVGTLSAAAPGESPLLLAGADPVTLGIREVTLALPMLQLSMAGQVGLFGEPTSCTIEGQLSGTGGWSSQLLCEPEVEVALLPGVDVVRLALRSLFGGLSFDPTTGQLVPDLRLVGTFAMDPLQPGGQESNGNAGCHVLVEAALDGAGFRATRFAPRCADPDTRIALDWLEVGLDQLRLNALSYSPGGGFQFDGSLSIHPHLPGLPELDLPPLEGLGVGTGGLSLPSLVIEDLGGGATAAGLGISLERLETGPLELAWEQWSSGNPGAFALSASASVTLPGNALPPCVGEGWESVGIQVANGVLRVVPGEDGIPPPSELDTSPEGCRLELGGGAALVLGGLQGEGRLSLRSPFEIEELPTLQAALLLPDALRCPDGEAAIVLPGGIPVPVGGAWDGVEIPLTLPCEVPLSVLSLELTDPILRLDGPVGDPDLRFAGGARVRLGPEDEPVQASGQIVLDPRVPSVVDGSLQLDAPVRIGLPRDEPVFVFEVASALLDAQGLHVDGRQRLHLDESEMGVTFQEVRFALEQPALEEGMILFDAPFLLRVGIEEEALQVRLEDADDEPGEGEPGATEARIRLPPTIALTPQGLQVEGAGTAGFSVMDLELPEVAAGFRDSFTLGFGPAEVTEGAVDLSVSGSVVATLDPSGLHLNMGALAEGLLPARLGLPTEALAYLELRDEEGELRVSVEPEGESEIRIQGTVPLALPILGSEGAPPPSGDVTVDLRLDRVSSALTAGDVELLVGPELEAALDLPGKGIPLSPRRIRYALEGQDGYVLTMEAGVAVPALEGELGELALRITPAGRLQGSGSVPVPGTLPFLPASDAFAFAWEGADVAFDLDLSGGSGSWSVSLPGNVSLALGEGDPVDFSATLALSDEGVTFQNVQGPDLEELAWVTVGPVEMGLGNITLPVLERSPDGSWDFDVAFDLALRFPDLPGVELPPFHDLRLRPGGLSLPALQLPELDLAPLEMAGVALQPLAFRMDPLDADPLGGGGWPEDFGFRFDLELSLPGLPGGAPQALKDLRLSVLDAGFGPGGFSGTIEPTVLGSPIPVPLGGGGMALLLGAFGGSLDTGQGLDGVDLQVAGGWRLPELLRCQEQGGDVLDMGEATIRLRPDGRFSGSVTDLLPACPYTLGPVTLALTRSDLVLEVDPQGPGTLATLDADVQLALPGPLGPQGDPGPDVLFTGSVGLDLLNPGVRHGSIALAEPFGWGFPREDPVLSFTIQEGVLDDRGLVFTGSGELPVAGGPGVQMAFDGLTVALPGVAITGGSATFGASFGFEAGIADGGLAWGVVADPEAVPLLESGLRIAVPAEAVLDASGLGLTGTGSAALSFGGESLAELAVAFDDGFSFALAPFAVEAGRASFVMNESEVAFLDRDGFWPGDIFGVLPIPTRLALPTEELAYLQLRHPDTDVLLVEAQSVDEGYRIRTRPQETVSLVVPAFSEVPGGTPAFEVAFEIVVNPGTWGLVSGAVSASVAQLDADEALFSLESLGIPLDITAISYSDGQGSYALTADARLRLPESMMGLEADLVGLTVSADGLAGEARLGRYREGAGPEDPPLLAQDLGPLTASLTGVLAVFGPSQELRISGEVRAELFREPGEEAPGIGFEGMVAGGGSVDFSAEPLDLPNGRLPLGLATFEPLEIGQEPGLGFFATPQTFGIRLGGVLRVPALAEDFALTLPGLEISNQGVTLPALEFSDPEAWQTFGIFGVDFTLRDGDQGSPALALASDDGVLSMTMSGELAWLSQTSTFDGLRVATDGSVGLEQASLLSNTITLVPQVLTLASLGIEDAALKAAFDVELPGPLGETGPQRLDLSVASDGTVEGGGTVVLLDETAGLGGDRTQFGSDLARFHLRYLAMTLNTNDLASGGVEAVADVYLANEELNRVKIGDRPGQSVLPGLRIGFDGALEWGNVTLAREFELDYEVLKLGLSQVSAQGSGGDFSVGFSGGLSVALASVSGGLDFTDIRLSTSDGLGFDEASISGGNLSVAGVLSLQLQAFEYSDTPTQIEVQAGSMPTAQNASVGDGVELIEVETYVRFGGSVEVAGLAGGVEEFLFYRTAQGETVMVVRDAGVTVPGVFQMSADIRYRANAQGFELLVGAEAMVMEQWGGRVVGMIEMGQELRAGLFVTVSAEIPLVPPVLMLAQVGGGFFYNPRPEHIQMVRTHAGVSGTPASAFDTEPGRFVALLFAEATIVERSVAYARILLTISEVGAQLDGRMGILAAPQINPGDAPIRADVQLAIGFKQFWAEGNATLTVDFSPIVAGGGTIEFFVYGGEAWGMMGSAHLNYLSLVQGNAEFLVGPAGFLVEGSIHAGFDFWIVSVSGSLNGAVWYRTGPGGDWGSYMTVSARASILGGAVSASATLRGALVTGPLVYAGASASGCVVILGCADVDIWAKFQNGSVRGGFGKDPTMDQIIARAQGVRNDLYDARDALVAAAAAPRPAPDAVVMGEDELLDTYNRLQAAPALLVGIGFAAALQRERETQEHSQNWAVEESYFQAYSQTVIGSTAPSPPTSRMNQLRTQIEGAIAEIGNNQSTVTDRAAAIQAEIAGLREVASGGWPESPLQTVSHQPPVTRTEIDAEGNEIKVMEAGPGFQLDEAADAQLRSDMESRQEETDQVLQDVQGRIQEVEAGVAELRILLRDRAPGSLLHFAELHATVLTSAEEQYALQGDGILRRQDWLEQRNAFLTGRRPNVLTQMVNRRNNTPAGQWKQVALNRAEILDIFSGSGSTIVNDINQVLGDYEPSDPAWGSQADSLGVQFWNDIGRLGTADAASRAPAEFSDLRNEANLRLNRMWLQLSGLSISMDRVYREYRELVGVLYDLYDRYRVWIEDAEGMEGELGRVQNRLVELQRELTAPGVSGIAVVAQNKGYYSKESFVWMGDHPGGVYEYLFASMPGSYNFLMVGDGEMPILLQSSGGNLVYHRFGLTPARGTESETRTLLAAVRGGAGYLGLGRSEYQSRFEAGEGQPAVTVTSAAVDNSPPSPPIPNFRRHDRWSATNDDLYWLPSADRVEFRWNSIDRQSGIAEYEYAVGTVGDTTAVREWTSVGARREVAVHGLAIPANEDVHVFARARNGQGLWSQARSSSPFRYDDTPPEWLTESQLAVLTQELQLAGPGRVGLGGPSDDGPARGGEGDGEQVPAPSSPMDGIPSFQALNAQAFGVCPAPGPSTFVAGRTPYRPTAVQVEPDPVPITSVPTLQRPSAVDPQSGVLEYAWRVDVGEPSGGYDPDSWTAHPPGSSAITPAGDGIGYGTDLHLQVVALNRGFGVSDARVQGFRVPDPTPPQAMRFCLDQANAEGRLAIGMVSAPRDPETGIDRVTYRIRTEAGNVLRDFAETSDIDPSELRGNWSWSLEPVVAAPGARLMVDVAVQNGDGMWSHWSAGPLLADWAPPGVVTPQSADPRLVELTGMAAIQAELQGLPLSEARGVTLEVSVPSPGPSGLQSLQWGIYPVTDLSPEQEALFAEAVADAAARNVRPPAPSVTAGLVAPSPVFVGAASVGSSLTLTTDSPYPPSAPFQQLMGQGGGQDHPTDHLIGGGIYELRIRAVSGAGVPGPAGVIRFHVPDGQEREREGRGEGEQPRGGVR